MSCWWRFLEVVVVIITIKAHNVFHSLAAPSSLHLHTLLTWTIGLAKHRFLSDQYCVQSLGYKCLVLSQAIYMPHLSSSQQNCGELDCGLQFLCNITDVSWWKGKKNQTRLLFFQGWHSFTRDIVAQFGIQHNDSPAALWSDLSIFLAFGVWGRIAQVLPWWQPLLPGAGYTFSTRTILQQRLGILVK